MKKRSLLSLLSFLLLSVGIAQQMPPLVVRTVNGDLEGVYESGIRTYKGVPFAQPPVGELRWKEPQPVKHWDGIRKADKFGPRAQQLALFTDMVFRSDGMSEDCLYLNVWTPARTAGDKLPVLVYFYGGGMVEGDGSEPRYDGESLARRGIVAITVNYRLSVFGFLAHPELTKESPHHASGNYGLMDQYVALQWVQENIAAFGGDPARVTIAGESAGSFSVSAQMASPLSKNLFAQAIGESGSLLSLQPPTPLASAEKMGVEFATTLGARSLAELRAMPASAIIQATSKPGAGHFPVTIDGYFFPRSPADIFTTGDQAKVPLLAGWNSGEGSYHSILGKEPATKENFDNAVKKLYGDHAADMQQYYHAATDEDVQQVGTDLAGDRFIGFSTWRWSDLHAKTGGKPVYRYFYEHPRPAMRSVTGEVAPAGEKRYAVHSAEIEYALGNLPTNLVFNWQPDDYLVSTILEAYFANFIKTGDPNGLGLPVWPAVKSGGPAEVMHIDVKTAAATEQHRDRYLFLEQLISK